jgi:hypothetical protein
VIPALGALQDGDGFFSSRVRGGGLDTEDRNGFATAQVLRALGGNARRVLGARGFAAALAALEACRNPDTGGFRFWPLGRRPAWAPDLPDDADDTALMALALWRAGLLGPPELGRLACRTVVRHRLSATAQPGPAWPRIGAFKTWMRHGAEPAIADCTVNANVVALLAAAGLRGVSGYAQACGMIADGVAWADGDERRAQSLSPFYPEPGELVLAVEAAAQHGAEEMEPVLATMAASPLWRGLRQRSCGPEPAICGSPYGLVRWTSIAVARARRIGGLSPSIRPASRPMRPAVAATRRAT